MSGFVFDPSRRGFRKVLREYEVLELRFLWSLGDEGAGSRAVMEAVNERLGEGDSKSRATFIISLNRLVDWGVLGFREVTGKGGYHRIYYPLMDEVGFQAYLLETMVESMRKDFPEETREVLEEYL
jgi:predicted transcriptional regulator